MSDSSNNSEDVIADDSLLQRLLRVQQDLRETLLRYKIKSGTLGSMARQAKRTISSAEVRADFLEMLIDLQELGTQAKRRGLLDEAAMTDSGELSKGASEASAKRRGTPQEPERDDVPVAVVAPENENRSEPNRKFSNDFFKRLDDDQR